MLNERELKTYQDNVKKLHKIQDAFADIGYGLSYKIIPYSELPKTE